MGSLPQKPHGDAGPKQKYGNRTIHRALGVHAGYSGSWYTWRRGVVSETLVVVGVETFQQSGCAERVVFRVYLDNIVIEYSSHIQNLFRVYLKDLNI